MDRRRFFVMGGTLALSAFAGCTGDDGAPENDDNETDDTDESATGDDGTDTTSDDGSDGADEVTPPQTAFSWQFEATAGKLTLYQESGESIAAYRLTIAGPGAPDAAAGKTWATLSDDLGAGDETAAGDRIVIEGVQRDAVIELLWVAPDGSQEALLSEWQGPAA